MYVFILYITDNYSFKIANNVVCMCDGCGVDETFALLGCYAAYIVN